MENNNINRISATARKSVEIDELNTPQMIIIIDNEVLQHFHKYNLLIPSVTEGFYNSQEEMDNIMISTQHKIQNYYNYNLQAGLTTTNGNLASATVAGGAATSALTAFDIANQKNWIIFWHAPFNYNVTTNHLYLNINNTYFSIDTSDN